MSSAEQTERVRHMCKDLRCYRNLWIRYVVYEIKLYMCSRDELFMHSLECYFGVSLNKQQITLSLAHRQFATRAHALYIIYIHIELSYNEARQ